MDQATLLDRMRWGMNIAAMAMGAVTDVYRPQGPLKPLDHVNRILWMHAAFTPRGGSVVATNVYGEALWHGIFDAAYTHVGDTCFTAKRHPISESSAAATTALRPRSSVKRSPVRRTMPSNAGSKTVE